MGIKEVNIGAQSVFSSAAGAELRQLQGGGSQPPGLWFGETIDPAFPSVTGQWRCGGGVTRGSGQGELAVGAEVLFEEVYGLTL